MTTEKRKADISELDDEALRIKVTWKKIHGFVRSFAAVTLDTYQKFDTTDYGIDKYGVAWSFDAWLGFKAGLVESQVFRLLDQFEKRLTDDQREIIAKEKQRMSDEKRSDSDQRRQEAEERRKQREADAKKTEEEREEKRKEAAERKAEKKHADELKKRRKKYAEDKKAANPQPQPKRRQKSQPVPPREQSIDDIGHELAVKIQQLVIVEESARQRWIEAQVELALLLRQARELYISDTLFGHWLEREGVTHLIDRDKRAALIGMAADSVLMREVLEDSTSTSIRIIWKNEEFRFRNIAKATEEAPKAEQYQGDTVH